MKKPSSTFLPLFLPSHSHSFLPLHCPSQTRAAQGINVKNSIIIFDEAHNIEKSCEEAASFELTMFEIGQCIDEVQQVIFVILLLTGLFFLAAEQETIFMS
jgi:hypothetical protein